tara:strand:+ start:1873 stop:2397 length:525 start_codon:yes stop_codon:yes gene_type:complete
MIHLNIGSSLKSRFGDKFDNIITTIKFLALENILIKKISHFYETPSYPNKSLSKFINIGVDVTTNLSLKIFFKKLKDIEKKIGRIKSQKNAPRVCDIDIIDFNQLHLYSKELKIPHPRMHLRNFVLYPLYENQSNWIHPISKKKIDFYLNRLNLKSHIEITRLHKSDILRNYEQ